MAKKTTKAQEAATATPETSTEFQSMCGQDYNPKTGAVCQKECANENPDDHKACVEHFAASAQGKKAAAKKPTVGMNAWNHRNGCQGDRIDQLNLRRVSLAQTLRLRTR